jgi:hypothetical protein
MRDRDGVMRRSCSRASEGRRAMETYASEAEAGQVDRLARWLAFGAIFFGVCSLLQAALLVLANGPSMLSRSGDGTSTFAWYRVSFLIGIGASALLVVGGIALWRRRPWARVVLLVYAGLAIAVAAFAAVFNAVFLLSQIRQATASTLPASQVLSGARELAYLGYSILSMADNCLLPVIVLLCLTRLGVGTYSPGRSRGFQPVMPMEQ